MENCDPTQELTRRQFFARLRKVGYKRAEMELSRNSITYEKECEKTKRIIHITLPTSHTDVVQVMGPVLWRGWHAQKSYATWHQPVPEGWDLLHTILGLASGWLILAAEPEDKVDEFIESTLIEEDEEE